MNLWKIVTSKIRGKSISDGLSWEPQYNTRFYVVDKHTGQVEYFEYIYHENDWKQRQISIWSIFTLTGRYL